MFSECIKNKLVRLYEQFSIICLSLGLHNKPAYVRALNPLYEMFMYKSTSIKISFESLLDLQRFKTSSSVHERNILSLEHKKLTYNIKLECCFTDVVLSSREYFIKGTISIVLIQLLSTEKISLDHCTNASSLCIHNLTKKTITLIVASSDCLH